MNKKLMMVAGVAMTAMLGGCANTDALEASVANLGNKVDQLSADVSSLKAEQGKVSADAKAAKTAAMDAQAEAKRANDRIDNMASSYKK
ncbi:MAG: Lpp/OprI family alanine-zipper lipoprotein [Shewanella sp.]|nr:Lpp/OprI family alanine-zipper lipoprotein [Shewanella sp.]MCF1431676.1 Lpp/OprI family alanine-zipper lipoprotein [Shewanella sp.]MCF1457297.1 Lpp/OprI family alanine-zipper lipoprotein [Shewanella sp.]